LRARAASAAGRLLRAEKEGYTAMAITGAGLALEAIKLIRDPPIPYVYGKRDPASGMDCSGLVQYARKMAGGGDMAAGSNRLWTDHCAWRGTLAEAQKQGKLVPGALVFIDDAKGGSNGTPGKMSHVGVYVGGSTVIVHASQSRGGVYPSTLKNAWTHVMWLKGVDYDILSLPSTSADLPARAEPGRYAVVTEDTYLYPAIPGPGEAMVIKEGVRMRKQPKIVDGINHNRICTVPNGTIMPILERHKDWTRLEYGIHRAWIRNDMLAFG